MLEGESGSAQCGPLTALPMTGTAPISDMDEAQRPRWRPVARMASLLAVLLVAVGVRLVAHAEMARAADTFAPIIDGESYLLQALRVAAGRSLVEGVTFQAPLYPWVLGQTLRLSGVQGVPAAETLADVPPVILARALEVARDLNLVLGVLLVALVWFLADRLLGDGAALAAGLLAALYGPLIFHEGLVMKEVLALASLPLAVLAATRALEAEARGRDGDLAWLLTGLALGVGALLRGNLHVVAGLGALAVLLRGGPDHQLRGGLRGAVALVLGVVVAMAPIVLRNSLAAGRPVLSTAAGGTAFYLCNHPDNDTGIIQHRALNRQVPRHEEEDWTAEAQRRSGRVLSPGEVSEFWFRAALAGIAERPSTWLLAEVRKLFLLFSRYEAPDNSMPSFAEAEVAVLRWTPSRYGVVLPLACGGLWLAWRRRTRGAAATGRAALFFALVAYAASLLLFIVTSRFRLPLAPLVIVYAGWLLSELRGLFGPERRAERREVAAAVALGLLLSLVSESALGPLSSREKASHVSVCLKNRAQVAMAHGDLDRARADLQEASIMARGVGLDAPAVHAELARLDRSIARTLLDGDAKERDRARELQDRAARELQEALALAGPSGMILKEQGLLAYDQDRFEQAAELLVRARAELPRDRELLQYLALSCLQGGRPADALEPAQALVEQDGEADDGWGLLALALARGGRTNEARDALQHYDSLAELREARGLRRVLPEVPDFEALRHSP